MNFVDPIRSALLAFVLVLSLGACTRTTPEQQLRDALSRMQSGIESRDAGAVKKILAEDFIGPGGLDRTGAGALCAAALPPADLGQRSRLTGESS